MVPLLPASCGCSVRYSNWLHGFVVTVHCYSKEDAHPYLNYCDVIYDQAFNKSFHKKLETIQYNAALAISGAIRGTSTEKLYQELGIESLKSRRWFRKLCLFYKIVKNKSPPYLYDIIPKLNPNCISRNSHKIPQFKVKHSFFENSFFPSAVIEWNKLDTNICNSTSLNQFKARVLEFIRPKPNSIFNVSNHVGIKLLTRLRVGFSHLREHKFRHNFQDSLNPLCSCGQDAETTTHFFLHCNIYSSERKTLLDKIKKLITPLLVKAIFQLLKLYYLVILVYQLLIILTLLKLPLNSSEVVKDLKIHFLDNFVKYFILTPD